MKAALYKGIREIEWQGVEYTPPAPGYITLETRSSGICGSDLHNYFGEWKPSLERAAGHELCGTVAEVGERRDRYRDRGSRYCRMFFALRYMSLLCYRSLQSLRQSQVVFGRISRWLFGIHYRACK